VLINQSVTITIGPGASQLLVSTDVSDTVTADCLMQASCQIVGIEVYNLPCGRIPDDCVQHEERKQPEMRAVKGREKDAAPRGHMTCTLSLCLMQKLLNILTWSEGWQDNFRQSKVVSKVLAAVGHILQVKYMLCAL
jgi:hypothetical protein